MTAPHRVDAAVEESRADALAELEAASALRRGVFVWYGVVGGLGAWTVHLVSEAALVHWTGTAHQSWILHAVTAVCIVATAAAIAVCLRLRRIALDSGGVTPSGRAAIDEDATDSGEGPAPQMLFLAHLGLLFNSINLLLIVIEGAYAVVLFQAHTVR